jgi:hypothetical protein
MGLLSVTKFTTLVGLNRPAILLGFDDKGGGLQFCARSGAWRGRLRGCPPAFGLLVPLRRPRQATELRIGMAWCHKVDHPPLRESRSAVYSAQRHQGGVGGPKPPRRTAAELSTPPTCSRTKQGHAPLWVNWVSFVTIWGNINNYKTHYGINSCPCYILLG